MVEKFAFIFFCLKDLKNEIGKGIILKLKIYWICVLINYIFLDVQMNSSTLNFNQSLNATVLNGETRQSVASRLTRFFGFNTFVSNTSQVTSDLSINDLTNRLSNLIGLSSSSNRNNFNNNFAQRIGNDTVREVLFDPLLGNKIAQLQNTVEVLRQFSAQYVQNWYVF